MEKKGYRVDHCSGENCGRDFVHGMLCVNVGGKIYCEHCCKKNRFTGQAVVYGGGDPDRVSSVSRDRAQRKLKKLARSGRRLKR